MLRIIVVDQPKCTDEARSTRLAVHVTACMLSSSARDLTSLFCCYSQPLLLPLLLAPELPPLLVHTPSPHPVHANAQACAVLLRQQPLCSLSVDLPATGIYHHVRVR